jgi:predicted esterase
MPWADRHRLLLVAPKSAAASWDVIAGGFGPDVRAIDALLTELSGRHPVSSYAVTGFSDGASYALTLGLVNGDLFDAVVAWSPGFQAAPSHAGRPRFFVSHGTDDQVLPIAATSRRLVPVLEKQGYDVTYVEYPGGHVVTEAVRRQAVEWMVADAAG